ncbi:MAG: sulfatase [Armatimonadota bacterium]|nr:sulfatase [Armatimonadota bacterium]
MPDRPNVVILVTHDTGQHVSPYGIHTVHTPACERLAAEGVRFAKSFCTAPLCSPSRAALFTGRYPHQNGVMGLVGHPRVGGWDLARSPGERHAAKLFAEAGYATVLCGNLHEASDWRALGFHQAISGSGTGANDGGDILQHADHLDAWLARRNPGQPFYLQIGSAETHRPWRARGATPDDTRGVWMPPYLRDLPELREEMAELQGAVRRYDTALGRILNVLDRHGLAEHTIFVSTTDHGIDVPRAKGTFYDPGIETLLFMRYPAGGWGAGRVVHELVSNVDILPTLLEACGLEVPGNLAGRSFLPLLKGEPYSPREVLFAEKTYHDTYDPTRALRTARYKYIRYFEVCIFPDLRLATIPRTHYFKEWGLRNRVEELYDLQSDPWEEHDLAGDPACAPLLDEMRTCLARWMRETDDPLVHGPVASPYFEAQRRALLEGAEG